MQYKFLGTRFHYDNVYHEKPIELNYLQLIQIGEICLEAGFEIESHNQFCFEISYIISGKGKFIYNNIETEVSAGDIIITPDKSSHSVIASNTDEINYCYMGFKIKENDSEISKRFFSVLDDKQITKKITRDIYEYFKNAMDEIYKRQDFDKLLIETYLFQIILLAIRTSDNENTRYTINKKDNVSQPVYLIIKYIDRNIDMPLTVSGIAESLGYSIYYVSHLFKSKMHITLQDYIITKKIERAKKLIEDNRYTITQIAEKLSYNNIQSFSRSFKNITGLSPKEYAKKAVD